MNRNKVIVFDTSVILCWLKVPGKDTCGSNGDIWDFHRVDEFISKQEGKATFVLPLASLIESGNHIAQCNGERFNLAKKFCDEIISPCIDANRPWAAFSDQNDLWATESLSKLIKEWPTLAAQKLSLGDATIKSVAEKYAEAGMSVEIFTGDEGLKAYQPQEKQMIPRRRRT